MASYLTMRRSLILTTQWLVCQALMDPRIEIQERPRPVVADPRMPPSFSFMKSQIITQKQDRWAFSSDRAKHRNRWGEVFSMSFSKIPYYNESEGQLLVHVERDGPYSVRAICDKCPIQKLVSDVQVDMGYNKIFVPFSGLPESLDAEVRVEIVDLEHNETLYHKRASLRRAPDLPRGRVAVNAKSRSLEVDGRPFLPISWFTTLEHGYEVTRANLRDMSHRGVNSVMIYNLVPPPSKLKFATRGAPVHWMLLDAAVTLGIKVHVYLLDFVDDLTRGKSDDWEPLEHAIKQFRDHPAVLSWYLADDNSGLGLPDVYKFIKKLDPYHPISISVSSADMATDPTYVEGADIVMVEVYGGDADEPYRAHQMSRQHPAQFVPQLHCGRAWSQEGDGIVISRQTFRSQLYHAILGGATGEVWFRYHEAKGWNNPGVPLLEASSVLGRELMDLVPSILSGGQWDDETRMPELTVYGVTQDGDRKDEVVKARAFREASGLVHLVMVNGHREPMQVNVKFAANSPGVTDGQSPECVAATVPFEASAWKPRDVKICNGEVSEWLPAWGTQVFRLQGTSSDVSEPEPSWPRHVAEFRRSRGDQNLLVNPSFETSSTFVSAPDGWYCGMSEYPKGQPDSSCFADTSVARTGRHSGRFVSGQNTFFFKIQPSTWDNAGSYDGHLSRGSYSGSVYAQADSSMKMSVVMLTHPTGSQATEEEILAQVDLSSNGWTRVEFQFNIDAAEPSGGSRVAFKVSKPGTVWLDDAGLWREQAV